MTLVSEIITDAHRQSNLLPIGTAVTTAQTTEGLRYLNRLVRSVFGFEVGELLEPLPIGRLGIDSPSGFPYYSQVPGGDWYVPVNKRLMLNLSAAQTVFLHPQPNDGARFAVVDASNNLATFNLIVDGNGRNIETTATVTLNVNGTAREWFYREDLGNWLKTTALVAADTFPFPEEFDDYFITMLAMRLNPAYGMTLDSQSVEIMKRAKTQIQARYAQIIQQSSESGLLRMPRTAKDRDRYSRDYGEGDPTASFNRGGPW